ncbi:flagellar basal-body rod protein FlgF [Lachnospiraceae bacterium HCP1S3_C3]|nr:flagellar basal-body rod protein FlgF [Lachnospiraceae bacterium]MDD6858108.1 flagellar basal-body rod protein FlgF [Lachnospiraceae bacterium]
MVRGLYTAYTGMLNQQKKMDTLSNNLANADTTGYKKEGVTAKTFETQLAIKVKDGSNAYIDQQIGKLNLGVKIGENYTDYSQGSYRYTGNTYDLALGGDGFFNISFMNKAGEQSVKYTRDGNFTIDNEGALRTQDGDYVLGESGEIYIPTNAVDVSINKLGEIYADGEYIDTIKITDFEDYNYLKKYGENMYDAVEGATEKEPTATIDQGYLEQSNINVVTEMVNMISLSRTYEANQKLIQTMDDALDKSANQIGKV